MAVKSWHITVMLGAKTVETKTFLAVGDANTHFKAMLEKYPKPKKPTDPKYAVYKENY